MCMTREEIYNYCVKLSLDNNDIFSIPVLINNRLSSTLGRVILTVNRLNGYATPTRLEISGKLLQATNKDNIEQIIKHEWAHYYLTKTTHIDHGHDWYFQQLCAKIGCIEDGKTSNVVKQENKELLYKYTIYCKNCGAFLGGKSRMCAQLRDLNWRYHCPKCKSSNLFFKTNW